MLGCCAPLPRHGGSDGGESSNDEAAAVDAEVNIESESEDDGWCKTNSENESIFSWRAVALKLFCGLLGFVLVVALLEHFVGEEVRKLSTRLVHTLGVAGLSVAVLVIDGVPLPLTYIPLIYLAVQGGLPKEVVFGGCAGASLCAAIIGYLVGMGLKHFGVSDSFTSRIPENYAYVLDAMQRHGAWGVGCAALLPMPFAIATWSAGVLRVSFLAFLAGACCRALKIALFVLLSNGPLPHKIDNVNVAAQT